MEPDGMNVGAWMGAVQNGVSAAAIIAGAIWGYYKFVRGRTFARRAEPAVSGELFNIDDERQGVRVRVSLSNTGAVDIPLRVKAIYASALWPDPRARDGVREETITAAGVLRDHDKVEAQEVISDEVLVPLRPMARVPPAYGLRFLIYDERDKPGATLWSTKAVIPTEQLATTETGKVKGGISDG